MASNSEDGYYGLSYGLWYGIGEPMPERWFATILPPTDSEAPGQVLAEEILSVDIQPEHSALWDAQLECAPTFDPSRYQSAIVLLRWMDEHFLAFRIESTDTADDGTVTITGREASGLHLIGDEQEIEYRGVRAVTALRDYWTRTPYQATVRPPISNHIDDVKVFTAQSATGFEKLLKARPRDEQGRFLEQEDGSAPNFMPTDPLKIASGGVELRQSNWVCDSRETTTQKKDVSVVNDTEATSHETLRLRGSGASIEFTIKTGYEIPQLAVAPRWRAAGVTNDDVVAVDIDGSTLRTTSILNITPTDRYRWREPFRFVRSEPLSAGEHTVTITKTAGSGDLFIDLVSMCDTRFSYHFDDQLDANNQLFGPELYPEHFEMELEPVEPGIDVEGIDITATFSDPQPNTKIGLYSTGMGVRYSEQTQATQTHHFNTPGEVPEIIPLPRISRTGGRRANETPTTGYRSQTLEGISATVDGEAVAVIHDSGQSFSGTDLEILQSLHEFAGYNFSLKHERGKQRAESFEQGDPAVTRDLPSNAVVTSRSTTTNNEGYANRVTVVGAEYPDALRRDGDPRRFEATAEDTGEIERVGLDAVTITDHDLETEAACLSRARTELRKRLNTDARGGSIDTTPAIVEPGYPYQIPVLTRSDALRNAPSLGDVPSGALKYVLAGDLYVVRQDVTIAGTLVIVDGGRVVVFGGNTVTVPSGGEIIVNGTGEMEIRTLGDEIITCESWSFSESAGSASASGQFNLLGGALGARDRAGVLGLLAGAAD